MNNAELIKALRNCSSPTVGSCMDCPYYKGVSCKWQMMEDAADALEAAERLLDQNTKRCEELRKQLREAHESYEKHINELEAQIPKEGEWIWLSSTYDRVPCEMRYWCSVCHHEEITHNGCKPWHNHCPNCGARMTGVQK